LYFPPSLCTSFSSANMANFANVVLLSPSVNILNLLRSAQCNKYTYKFLQSYLVSWRGFFLFILTILEERREREREREGGKERVIVKRGRLVFPGVECFSSFSSCWS
jgi:hypothetical protein